MTQHVLPEHDVEDARAMRNLLTFVGGFMVLTVFLALGVAFFAP